MKILVDEMPKEAKNCIFCSEKYLPQVCHLDGQICKLADKCPYLKEDKPAEDDCK